MTYSIRAYNKRQFQDNERGGGGTTVSFNMQEKDQPKDKIW